MTTTTSSFSNKRFWAYTAGLLKRNIGYMIFLSVVLTLFHPVQLALRLFSTTADQILSGVWSTDITVTASGIHTELSVVVMFIVVILASIVLSITQFDFMQSKRSTDLFHALPLRREQMYISGLLAGLTTVLVPLLISYGLSFAVAATKSMQNPAFTFAPLTALGDLLALFVLVIAIFACGAFAQVQVGRSFEGFIFSMELLFAPMALVLLTRGLCTGMLFGYSMESNFRMQHLLYYSPVSTAIMRLASQPDSYNFYNFVTPALFIWAAISAVLIGGGMWLYKRRKSEIAEAPSSTSLLAIAGKLAAVYVGGSGIGIMVTGIVSDGAFYNARFTFVLWTVLGAAITYVIMELILLRGFKGFRKSLPLGLASVGLVGAFVLIIATGGLGYETRIPTPSQVKSITINYRGRYNNLEFYDASTAERFTHYGAAFGREIVNYNYDAISTVTLSSPEAIALINEYHTRLVQYNRSRNLQDPFTNSPYLNISLEYNLGASKMYRDYNVSSYDLLPILAQLENLEEFKRQTHPLFITEAADYANCSVQPPLTYGKYGAEDEAAHVLSNPATMQQLIDALRSDMLAEKVTENAEHGASVVAYITFASKEDNFSKPADKNFYGNCAVAVMDSYTNTLEFLRKNGLDDVLVTSPEAFNSATVHYGNLRMYYYGRGMSVLPFSGPQYLSEKEFLENYTNQDDIIAQTKAERIAELWNISSALSPDKGDSMTVIFTTEDGGYLVRFVPFSKLPKDIQQQFPDYEKAEIPLPAEPYAAAA